eukprot:CAMPEP_0114993228 /NCGR_PEP_ID=MMETSP0216-20121206/12404_1 /TAXON_ID=223996 /ORGANISM="Protocruzia adherens, Strain Boccale" /LENGTH=587 /DNA_ID=CAMNT_0002356829 /DNA_START=6 /DNA_END=1769 /DNA_ORIENTATION=+
MKTFTAILLCACIGLAAANYDWQMIDGHDILDDHAVSFKVAFKPQNMETLENLYWEISNPKSPFFGNHLTNEQIADLISLPAEQIQKVHDYIKATEGEHCAIHTTLALHRDYIFVDTCAAQAKAIFPNLNLAVYQRANGHKVLRSSVLVDLEHNLTLLGVPHELHQYIQGIHDVTDMPVVTTRNTEDINVNNPWLNTDKELTIKEMIAYFGIDYSVLKASALTAEHGQVRAAVVEYGGGAFSPSDLQKFQKKYQVPNNPIKKVIGTEETASDSAEASLDVQTISSIAQGVQIWDFVFGSNFDFVPAVEKIMSTENAPRVISLSYGEPETVFGASKVSANNTAFLKFGLAGFTWLASSGDVGPVLNPSACAKFDAEYPAASPYVVAVGGTALDKTTSDQHAWIHSSGGFSVFNKMPTFQKTKVQHYLDNASSLPSNPNGATYNTNNRAYPDVSAFGAWEPVLNNGFYQGIGGTSGACPQFAAVIAMVNVYRYQNGLGPLGALTQTLWTLEDGVGRDVTLGQNYATSRFGCYGQSLSGFKATEGWDPATGIGSPKWETLLTGLGSIKGSQTTKKDTPTHNTETEFLPLN